MSEHSKRKLIKSIALTAPLAWARPVVDSVVLPAHARVSCVADDTIRVVSPGSNGGLRVAVLINDSDVVLARCCCGDSNEDIIIEAQNLPAGSYRVLGDSNVTLDHVMEITVGCESTSIQVETRVEDCNLLMAVVTLPGGTVNEESGQLIQGDFCGGPVNCLSGNND